ncbi:HAUS augmin-like complex subunit 7 isoform X1 [Oreochromis niloticus]|uniref:HAUS augmin-like complex subunit 7 isoform X1 n=1 Tax=Oreochromis niloticus TaxID=8128 RepID=UPI0009048897|nr:HAUS augmin-like complex subunit 7 isoform X1 [Oreochromis niloticus]
MAGVLTEKLIARHVYSSLEAASCPLVEGLYLQEADSMLQLLCSPSQHRTDILAWICSSISPNFTSSKAMSVRSKEPDVLTKDMAVLGQELLLCRASDVDLIRGDASPRRQLQFLEQLLTLVPGGVKSAGHAADGELLLKEFFGAESLPHLTQTLSPAFDPWPTPIKALWKNTKSSYKPNREENRDIVALLQVTQSALEQLQSKCVFLNSEAQSPPAFSPSSLRVAASDLQQLMATFSHVYETDLRVYCSRDPPSFSSETEVFQRVQQLLLACNTDRNIVTCSGVCVRQELEMLKEVSEASESVSEEVKQLQTQPRYWSRAEKHTLPDQLEKVIGRIGGFLSQLSS